MDRVANEDSEILITPLDLHISTVYVFSTIDIDEQHVWT